jgi:glyoxylate reductase
MMARVLVTQEIDPAGLALLEAAGLEVDLRAGDAPISRAELLARVKGCAALLPMPTDRIDGGVLDAAPELRVVANHAVGVDNVDLDAAAARGVVVTNTPGVLTEATADFARALLLAAARRVVEGDQLRRRGDFQGWRPTMLRGLDLDGARLGIVGYGRIGQATAARARAFGMEIVHTSRTARPDAVGLDELLATSDVVSRHCPLTAETRHLIAEPELRQMKATAVLVNTARGPVVDEAALVRALREGWIAAAGIDVFEREPEAHPGLLELPQAVLAPHLGSATRRTRERMATRAASNLIAALRGEEPPNRVA